MQKKLEKLKVTIVLKCRLLVVYIVTFNFVLHKIQ